MPIVVAADTDGEEGTRQVRISSFQFPVCSWNEIIIKNAIESSHPEEVNRVHEMD